MIFEPRALGLLMDECSKHNESPHEATEYDASLPDRPILYKIGPAWNALRETAMS
jgi:hypothetical protein